MGAGAAIGIGTILQLEAGESAAMAQRRALSSEAMARDAAAIEEERRSKRELDLFKKKGRVAIGDMVSGYAKAGVNLSDSAFLNVVNSKTNLDSDAVEMKRASDEHAQLIRMGAAQLRSEARDVARSQPINALATAFGGIGSVLSVSGKKT